MDFAFAPSVLTRDVVAADGKLIAARGQIVDADYLHALCSRARRDQRQRPLHETPLAEAVLEAFEIPALRHLVGDAESRGKVADALAEIRFPDAIWDEMRLLCAEDPVRHQHAIWSAVVAARLFRAVLGDAPGVSRLAGGALVHDIGMRFTLPRLRYKRDYLSPAEAVALEDHPLFGALLLASRLGDAPATRFALLHHTRSGFGYPRFESRTHMRGLDVLAVASAFAALVAPRPFRAQPFNARGAADQLAQDALHGHFDQRAVRLLIHCLRGGKGGPLQELQLPRRRTGFHPPQNHYGLEPRPQAQAGA